MKFPFFRPNLLGREHLLGHVPHDHLERDDLSTIVSDRNLAAIEPHGVAVGSDHSARHGVLRVGGIRRRHCFSVIRVNHPLAQMRVCVELGGRISENRCRRRADVLEGGRRDAVAHHDVLCVLYEPCEARVALGARSLGNESCSGVRCRSDLSADRRGESRQVRLRDEVACAATQSRDRELFGDRSRDDDSRQPGTPVTELGEQLQRVELWQRVIEQNDVPGLAGEERAIPSRARVDPLGTAVEPLGTQLAKHQLGVFDRVFDLQDPHRRAVMVQLDHQRLPACSAATSTFRSRERLR